MLYLYYDKIKEIFIMKKKFIQKMLAALCATTAIMSIAPSFASANPSYENIIDKNSQKPEDIKRNKIRRRVNNKFASRMLDLFSSESCQSDCAALGMEDLNEFVRSNVKNEFDRFVYQNMTKLQEYVGCLDLFEGYSTRPIKTDFNFLSTKMTMIKDLIESENDLIKRLLLMLTCYNMFILDDNLRPIFNYYTTFELNMAYRGNDPYSLKKIAEKIYIDYMRQYYQDYYINNNHNNNNDNNINQNNLQAKKAEYEDAIKEAEENLAEWPKKQEAYAAALFDAENQTEHNLTTKDDTFKAIYYKTLALANAEIHAKKFSGRVHRKILNENMQDLYDETYSKQFDNVVKQIGIRDGLEANEDQPSYNLDESDEKIYREGYLIGARKKAKQSICGNWMLNPKYEKKYTYIYKEAQVYIYKEAQEEYVKAFGDTLYEEALKLCSYGIGNLIDDMWNEFFNSDNNGDEELRKFKESVNKRYLDGVIAGCEKLGYKYATLNKNDEYKFEKCMKLPSLKSEEFKNECKKAYENGLKRGLAEIGKKMEIEEEH